MATFSNHAFCLLLPFLHLSRIHSLLTSVHPVAVCFVVKDIHQDVNTSASHSSITAPKLLPPDRHGSFTENEGGSELEQMPVMIRIIPSLKESTFSPCLLKPISQWHPLPPLLPPLHFPQTSQVFRPTAPWPGALPLWQSWGSSFTLLLG